MALKKSQLYSSLWQSCDELRGGMDASQYKDYVLTLLFVKYVSDKYAGKKDDVIEVPEGGGFADMVALKGDKDSNRKAISAFTTSSKVTCSRNSPGRSIYCKPNTHTPPSKLPARAAWKPRRFPNPPCVKRS